MTKQAVGNIKRIDDAMKSFKVVPLQETAQKLDKATQATIVFAAEISKNGKEECVKNG